MVLSINGLRAWKKFQPFQVFDDYLPMQGFRIVVSLRPEPASLRDALEKRAGSAELLDPALARSAMRAGLGLLSSGLVSFAYANAEECLAVIAADAVRQAGDPIAIHDTLVSRFSSRLSLLAGREVVVTGKLYEFPDTAVIRRAMAALVEEVEEATPLRSSIRLGAQLTGQGKAFHPSMVETLEEQTSLLQSNGIDMDALPSWWWRGVAGAIDHGGQLTVYDELPAGEAFGDLLPE
jgi:hypothetical protein